MKNIYTLFLGIISIAVSGQVGIGTTNPNPSSELEIVSTNRGMLIPRINLTDVTLITPIVSAPTTSLLVWNSNASLIGGFGEGYYYWDGSKWVALISTNLISTFTTSAHNTLDMAYDQGGVGMGRTINADNGLVHIAGGDGLRVTGTHNLGNYLGTTTGTQMFFYPRRAAFRTGTGSWSDVNPGGGGPGAGNIGSYSVAMGSNNTASGQFSLALVNGSSASAESAVAIGNGASAVQQDDMALGQGAIANGSSATAIGESTEATGVSSIAIGASSHSIGDNSTAIGNGSQAEAINSTAIGLSAQAIGDESLAIGNNVRTDSYAEFSLGINNTNGGGDANNWVATDRLFSIGNGATTASKSNAMVILKNGNTGIGFDSPTQKLDVNGIVKATSFISSTTTYPDYVFENYYDGFSDLNKDYKMLTLNEAEQFVQENGHLYGVKSFKDIKKDNMNVDVTEMTIKNLEKIEELFLYIVELKNENEKLKIEIEQLKKN